MLLEACLLSEVVTGRVGLSESQDGVSLSPTPLIAVLLILPAMTTTLLPATRQRLLALHSALDVALGAASSSSSATCKMQTAWLQQTLRSKQVMQNLRRRTPRSSALATLVQSRQFGRLRMSSTREAWLGQPASSNLRSTSSALPSRYFSSSRSARDQASTSQSATSSGDAEIDNDPSVKGKFKTLMRKYGWATVVVYLLFSVVDFGIAFFAINLVGAEHVRRGQDYVLDTLVYGTKRDNELVKQGTAEANGVLSFLKDWLDRHKEKEREQAKESKKGGSSGMAATAVLAYTIHKTLFLPLRLGATAAATPAIVRWVYQCTILN